MSERVTNSVGVFAASREVKRWMSMRWLTKWPARWKGQQVVKGRALSEGREAAGRASRRAGGAE
jgi:hypothetical protein